MSTQKVENTNSLTVQWGGGLDGFVLPFFTLPIYINNYKEVSTWQL